jgi:hypothetical protein
MIYPAWLSLKLTMIVVGLLLFVGHLLAWFKGRGTQAWLQRFPRNREAGVVLSLIAGAWFFFLVKLMDLGDFDSWRPVVLVGTPIAVALAIAFIPDFLAVRALGTCALLAAEPLLESAFLRPELVRLLLVILVYVWIVLGMFWVGMPFTLRDQITWVTASEKRWRAATFAGLAYGALMLVGGLLVR